MNLDVFSPPLVDGKFTECTRWKGMGRSISIGDPVVDIVCVGIDVHQPFLRVFAITIHGH